MPRSFVLVAVAVAALVLQTACGSHASTPTEPQPTVSTLTMSVEAGCQGSAVRFTLDGTQVFTLEAGQSQATALAAGEHVVGVERIEGDTVTPVGDAAITAGGGAASAMTLSVGCSASGTTMSVKG
jgi:hypothetical protein